MQVSAIWRERKKKRRKFEEKITPPLLPASQNCCPPLPPNFFCTRTYIAQYECVCETELRRRRRRRRRKRRRRRRRRERRRRRRVQQYTNYHHSWLDLLSSFLPLLPRFTVNLICIFLALCALTRTPQIWIGWSEISRLRHLVLWGRRREEKGGDLKSKGEEFYPTPCWDQGFKEYCTCEGAIVAAAAAVATAATPIRCCLRRRK